MINYLSYLFLIFNVFVSQQNPLRILEIKQLMPYYLEKKNTFINVISVKYGFITHDTIVFRVEGFSKGRLDIVNEVEDTETYVSYKKDETVAYCYKCNNPISKGYNVYTKNKDSLLYDIGLFGYDVFKPSLFGNKLKKIVYSNPNDFQIDYIVDNEKEYITNFDTVRCFFNNKPNFLNYSTSKSLDSITANRYLREIIFITKKQYNNQLKKIIPKYTTSLSINEKLLTKSGYSKLLERFWKVKKMAKPI